MIAISDNPQGNEFVVYLLHLGYKIVEYRYVDNFGGKKNYAYVFNERRRISDLKSMWENGLLDKKELLYTSIVPTPNQDE